MSNEVFVVSDPNVCGGKPVIKGTRVPVHYIVELLKDGMSPEEIHEEYPSVPLEVIRKLKEKLDRNEPIYVLVKV